MGTTGMRNPIHSAASTDSPRRPRALLHWGLLAACCAWSTLPAGSDVTVTASVIAGGGGTSQSSGACFALDGTIGQGVAGLASASNLELHSGYWAGIAASRRDALFINSFEECQ